MNIFEHDKDCLTGVLCTDTPGSFLYFTVCFYWGQTELRQTVLEHTHKKDR